MRAALLVRRFLLPAPAVSLLCWLRFQARVSPRAEVEWSPKLTLGRGVIISSFCKLKASDGPLRIGADTHIATGCFLGASAGGLEIGADCLIGPSCALLTNNYRYQRLDRPLRLQGQTSLGVRIGRNVQIGANSVVLDGSEIEDNVIVSAGSIVSGRVPANAILAGNPAKVVFLRR